MKDLIERLEKATEPDRELGAAIECVIVDGVTKHPNVDLSARGYVMRGPQSYLAPNYTGSIDAALTLVPKGWIVEIHRGFDDDDELWSKVVLIDSFSIGRGREPDERREVISFGVGEPPRLIVIAALRARSLAIERR